MSLTSLTDFTTISAPAATLLVYNTNSVVGAGYYFNSGTPASPVWKKLLNTGDAGGASGWGLTGNAGTDTAVNFIGTTTNMPIRFRINNIKSGQLSSSNVFLGDSVGVFTNETKSFRNIGIGRKALLSNDSGSYNVALGAFALSSAFGDAENVAIGDAALSTSDDYYGGGSINTAVGSSSLQDLIDGQLNTAVGGYSMISNWSGFANTSIGTFSDCLDTLSLIDVNNATAIGFGALADVDNMVKLGDESVTDVLSNGNFSTISDGRFKKDIKNENGGLDFIMQLRPVNYHYNVQKMIDSKIKVLSGRYKNSLGSKSDKITQKMLSWYNSPAYKKKTIENESRLHNGFIAQEVEAAANKVGYNFSGIMKPKNPNGRYALSYATFVVPLVEAVQQQQQTIEEQNKKIDALVKRLEILEQK